MARVGAGFHRRPFSRFVKQAVNEITLCRYICRDWTLSMGRRRFDGDSKVENRTLYINGDIPLGEAAEFYFTAGMQDRDASSAAFARGGIGSDDIPSRNSEAMYPDGFVPFIDGDLQDRYSIAGLRGDIGQWHWDLSHTFGSNELRYTINHTLNAFRRQACQIWWRRPRAATRWD